jgi:hypothetical protein
MRDPDVPRWVRAWSVAIMLLAPAVMVALIVALVFLANHLRESTGC